MLNFVQQQDQKLFNTMLLIDLKCAWRFGFGSHKSTNINQQMAWKMPLVYKLGLTGVG